MICENINLMHRCCHDFGLPTIALSIPDNKRREDPEYNDRWTQVNALLQENLTGVSCIIDTAAIVPFERETDAWSLDGLHLDPEGSELLGAGIASRILPYLLSKNRIAEDCVAPSSF